MTGSDERERPSQRQKGGHDRAEPPLQPAQRADADQLPHQQAELNAAGVNQQPLQNVAVTAKVHASVAA